MEKSAGRLSGRCGDGLGRRLAAARRFAGLSQGQLAAAIGTTRAILANIESGRSVLFAHHGWRACADALDVHPDWICRGLVEDASAAGGVRFVVPTGGKHLPFPQLTFHVEWWAETQFKHLESTPFCEAWRTLRPLILPDTPQATKLRDEVIQQWKRASGISEEPTEPSLTAFTPKSKSATVHSELSRLMGRVRSAASAVGMKSALATYLHVAPARISEWLSGRKEPSGETTLRLLQWVEAQERQQTQGPGSGTTPPGPKTRSVKHHETAQKSGPSHV